MKLTLTESELFKSLVQIESDTIIDLHNDYLCMKINYSADNKIFEVIFINSLNGSDEYVLRFEGVDFGTFVFDFKELKNGLVLDLFYRGRMLQKDKLWDRLPTGQYCYFVSFIENVSFELFANEVYLMQTNV